MTFLPAARYTMPHGLCAKGIARDRKPWGLQFDGRAVLRNRPRQDGRLDGKLLPPRRAHYACGDVEAEESLARYGMHLGVAFQIADDLLDVLGDEAKVGKSLGTDLLKQKSTLPLIRLLDRASAETRVRLIAQLRSSDNHHGEMLRPYWDSTDSIEYSREKAALFSPARRARIGNSATLSRPRFARGTSRVRRPPAILMAANCGLTCASARSHDHVGFASVVAFRGLDTFLPYGVAQLGHRPGLELANSLLGHTHHAPHLFESHGVVISIQPEAMLNDLPLAFVEVLENSRHLRLPFRLCDSRRLESGRTSSIPCNRSSPPVRKRARCRSSVGMVRAKFFMIAHVA